MISNPHAGVGNRIAGVRSATGVLTEGGWEVSWRQGYGEEATALARQAATEGMDVVFAAGGDGTINAVANGLVDTETVLGILPAGTGNVLAAQLGLVGVPTPLHPPNPAAAARRALRGFARRVDVGYAKPSGAPGRHFIVGAGIGLDAAITAAVEGQARDLKKVLGPAAFGAVGLRALLGTSGTDALVRCDGRRLKQPLLLAVVSNIRLYGGTLELTPEATMNDGLLDVALFFGTGPLHSVAHLGAVLTRRGEETGTRLQASSIAILTETPLPVQLDGDPFATTPIRFRTRSGRLWLLIPDGAPPDLFGGPPPEGSDQARRLVASTVST